MTAWIVALWFIIDGKEVKANNKASCVHSVEGVQTFARTWLGIFYPCIFMYMFCWTEELVDQKTISVSGFVHFYRFGH